MVSSLGGGQTRDQPHLAITHICWPCSLARRSRIDLPLYKNREDLHKFLTIAIQMEATGFGLE